MLWSTLPGFQDAESRARSWLLGREGKAIPIEKSPLKVIGHDPSLVGWPWVEATHSWLEPTALAILALCRGGQAEHPRVKAGVDLILDRALEAGGWNYGNKAVFGTELRPQPGPTGLALLALALINALVREPSREFAAYLWRGPPVTSDAPSPLGWGILGLRAHHVVPDDAATWLAEACSRSIGKPDAAMGLALLLLASSELSLGLLLL